MGKKNNIIEINGKRYDAHTGAAIDHIPVTVKPTAKSIAVHHADAPAIKEPAAHHHSISGRQPAKELSRHAPQRSKTLMRQAVKKPAAGLKRRVKAQSHTGNLAKQPAAAIVPKLSFGNTNPKRLRHASHVKKSQRVKHFNQVQPVYVVPVTVITPSKPVPAPAAPIKRQPESAPDASDIFDRAIQQATSHLEPAPKAHKKRRLHLSRKHARA